MISYGQSLRHARRGRKSPMTRNLNASTSASGGPERSSDETNRDASNDVSMQPNESSIGSRVRPAHNHYSEIVITQERSPLRGIQEL